MSVYYRISRSWFITLWLLLSFCLPLPAFAENPFEQETHHDGHFVLVYTMPKKQVYKDIQTIFRDSGQFQSIIKSINNEFIFPETITVTFLQGDGPVYLPDTKTIQMSYDFIFYLTTLYVDRYPNATDDEMMDFSLRTTTFLFYHEMAHAFIDLYQLPIVSNEETAADSLAVILALEFSKDGFKTVMDSAELFDLLDQAGPKKYDESDYWDEHALDAQRFYNILCMVYGKYPEKVTNRLKSIDNKKLDRFIEERGEACIGLYDQQLNAWSQLLKPYFKQ
jgi:hypothetical protein